MVFYHCHPRLEGTPFYRASLWGWAGVNLFFVLSGFLITSILLESRGKPHYFRNFYARRALRIWPVYVLVLVICYLNAPWFIGPTVLEAVRTAPWWAYVLFVQNLFHLALPPAIGPTWSLAIEEQYYFLWAPIVRLLARPWTLAVFLGCALIASPLFRMTHFAWITPTHTLTHLDGIAMGSLLAIGLHTLPLSRRAWLMLGLAGIVIGFPAAGTIAGGTAFLDTALTAGFGGVVLASIASTGARNPAECRTAPRPAGLLRPRELRHVHDPHHGVHLLRLVRPAHGCARHRRQSRRRRIPAGSIHRGRDGIVVRVRIADSQIEALFVTVARAAHRRAHIEHAALGRASRA